MTSPEGNTTRHTNLIPHNLRIGQQALFAFVDVLAKTFLTCVPGPPWQSC